MICRYEQALLALPQADQQALATQLAAPEFRGRLVNFEQASLETAQKLVPLAATYSVAPISGFHVGAVAIGRSGALYLGANLEFASAPLQATLHAEQSALLNARSHGEQSITALAVSAAPCGHCRQFLWELSNAAQLEILTGSIHTRLQQLLPMPFGSERATGEGLLDSPPIPLQLESPSDLPNHQAVLEAAKRSYAPYTHAAEGCLIECGNGQHFTGSSVESIAFNPSISAALAALNQRNLSSSRSELITHCTYAKTASSHSSNDQLTATLMQSVSKVSLQTIVIQQA